MHRLVKLISCFLLTIDFATTMACTEDHEYGEGVVITTEGEAYRDADVVYMTFYVLQQGALVSEVAKTAQAKALELVKSLEKVSKKIKSIEVTDERIGEKQKSYGDTQNLSIPEVVMRVRVTTTPDDKNIVDIVEIANKGGALMQSPSEGYLQQNNLGVIVYGLLNDEAAENEAVELVVKKTRPQAEKIAKAAGLALGSINHLHQNKFSGLWTKSNFPAKYLSSSKKVKVAVPITIAYSVK